MKNSNYENNKQPKASKVDRFIEYDEELSNKVVPHSDKVFLICFVVLACFNIIGWPFVPVFVQNAFLGIDIAFVGAYKIRKDRFDIRNSEHMLMFGIFVVSCVLAIGGVFKMNANLATACVWMTQGLIAVTVIYSIVIWLKSKRVILDKYDVIITILAFIQTLNIIH
ncbi:conserved membrane hypothetical protein [Vibrio jasicida]|uniref:Uncharacterized protein n=1 Tax=Vibrio jasicida TaxID=766224 RepID=A0AAU9QJR7_9VIBR|nr:conserved membrane hypothetical protein [Vibrio jasicida]CAH1596214.1 conserved membrane hypothetical protein [Vibrio jasicida]